MARLAIGVHNFHGQDSDIVEHLAAAMKLFLAASRIRPLEPTARNRSQDAESSQLAEMHAIHPELDEALLKHTEDVMAAKFDKSYAWLEGYP